jgi:hypothetical protein
MHVDPLAARVADRGAPIDAELAAVAADAKALRELLTEGSVVRATVLRSNGLTDLIEIGGLRVTASLPPSVRPGETLEVKVVAFEGERVRVQIVSPRPSPAQPIEARLAAARATTAPPPSAGRFVVPPPIAPKSAPSGLSAYAGPVALLRALKLPVTPSAIAAATMALERPERLAAALDALERALPQSDDPHVATARTLLAFVGKIDPRSPVLASQIEAFVDQVVVGPEPRLATLLAATQVSATAASGRASIARALAVERAAALNVDLKQTLLAIATDPATPAGAAPIAGAIVALTAVQLHAAQLLASRPDGIAFALPLVTPDGAQHARISVRREARQRRDGAPDGESFRIGFNLETAHLGSVAIDLVTVGREMTIDLRAENGAAMRAFRDALGSLTARLEALRYRVASAQARLASPGRDRSQTFGSGDSTATVDRSV